MGTNDEKLTLARKEIKELIADNKLENAINELLNRLVLHSEIYDSLILISAKQKRVEKLLHLNIATYQDIETETSKIENAVMYLLKNLTTDDLK